MTDRGMSVAEEREYAVHIEEARLALRQWRKARRHAFWRELGDALLSMPPGIAVRLGG
ncbi:hypothetical protein G5T42_12315 [Microbacterium sp. 4R-513]|uniref:hypothetical protein n=1 Tax=Microbacterium sp. 4R-513 TaxID=2567934 RepID=UPI0013E0EDA4|nr:hypothetical protein [Microbacterium sp. 4R-513]QIG40168.1 hypothetical protein G5T42_12315 [Microbacterium sp. 4R-513]